MSQTTLSLSTVNHMQVIVNGSFCYQYVFGKLFMQTSFRKYMLFQLTQQKVVLKEDVTILVICFMIGQVTIQGKEQDPDMDLGR